MREKRVSPSAASWPGDCAPATAAATQAARPGKATTATRLTRPGMTTALPAARPSIPACATWSAGIHITRGSAAFGFLFGETGRLTESGVHRPRTQRGRADPGTTQLTAQAVGVGQHERLGGAVRRLARQGLERGRRRHVQHRATMPVDHSRQEPAAQVDHRGHIDLDQVKFLFRNRFRDDTEWSTDRRC